MKQLLCMSTGTVRVVDVPIPCIGPSELLVQLQMCGVCGTDLMKVYSDTVSKPIHLGHEVVARVKKVGDGVQGFTPGQRVVLMHHVPDHSSHLTRHGSATMDPRFKTTDFDPGGFAEYIRLSPLHVQHATSAIPDQISDSRAVFAEPLSCVLRSLDRVNVMVGDQVAVIGVGAVGLLFVPLLYDLHATVLACDVRAERLALALDWRADQTLLLPPSAPASSLTPPLTPSCDLVILTVLNQSTLALAAQLVRDGGTILLFGAKPDTVLPVDLWQLWRREINLISSYGATPDLLPRALAILRRDDYAFETTISHQIALAEGASAFKLLAEGKAAKVVLTN